MAGSPSSENVQRLAKLFAGFEGAHGTHGMPTRNGLKWEIKSTTVTLRKPVTETLWKQHLEGVRPLGVISIKKDGTCSWGSIDVDQYDVNLLEIVERVEREKYPLVPCRSKSGGLHLFLFLSNPVQASIVQGALREMAASLGLAGSEIFPKQTSVKTERGDLGSWMVMPYFGGTFGGKLREQVGIRRRGGDLTFSEFLNLAEKSAVTEDQLVSSARPTKPRKSARKQNGVSDKAGEPFSDGPPCLQHMARGGFPEGGRNKAVFHAGLYFKRADQANWEQLLERCNQDHVTPSLSGEEIGGIIKSLKKKDYEYLCKDEPMCSHCDSVLCRARKYGVGGGSVAPLISGLSKLDTEPPLWFVDVEGQRVECTTEELQDYRRFHAICMSRLNVCYRSMKQDSWYAVIAEAMKHITTLEAPQDVGTPGRFRELLEDFCTDRARGERKEDLFSGRPWEDEETGRHYFRLRDLDAFLRREGVRDMTRGKITRHIANLGGDHHYFNIKGKGVNVFWVPSAALIANPPVDPPTQKEDSI